MIEKRGNFRLGRHEHNHIAKSGLEESLNVRSNVKKAAVFLDDVFRPTTALVEDVLQSVLSEKPCQSLPAVSNIVRTANRARQSVRPHDPLDLNFILDDNFIPTAEFQHIQRRAKALSPVLERLADYVDLTWISRPA